MGERVVCLDFDETLVIGYPNETRLFILQAGAKEALLELARAGCEIVVLTARPHSTHGPIRDWCQRQGLPVAAVTNVKPPAACYIDDSAIQHRGNWPDTLRQTKSFLGLEKIREVHLTPGLAATPSPRAERGTGGEVADFPRFTLGGDER